MKVFATPLFKYPLLLALALALASPLALADRGDRRSGGRGDDRANRSQREQQSAQQPSRYQRDVPPPGFERGADAQHHPRLSPEERRQLRRDIQDAGRDIYPQRR